MFLKPHVHAVRIGEDLVLLDVCADRYHCLPGGAELGLSDDRRRLRCCDAELAVELVAELVAYAADRPTQPSPDGVPSAEMGALVARYHRWACWMPAPSKCLIRSYTLLRLLRRNGFDARWVFAVKTWPFEAHCWLQAGSVILDDVPDRLLAYHPILVV